MAQAQANNGYAEGAITRIKLENFLTYDSVEFKPGPSLNVIIGPNGTGKSTIVCAICLGLAGKPSILGRTAQPMGFIKYGCAQAVIEIELHNKTGDNYIIRREVHRDNTSRWSVNDRPSTQKVVQEMMRRLNIQVGNLCQFLPQDKVADFAKMTQQELLENTEKAVGPPEMIEQHKELKVARDKERRHEQELLGKKDSLEREQTLNERLEQDVKDYRERERRLRKIKELNDKRCLLVYREKLYQISVVKEEREECMNKLKKAKQDKAPLQTQISSVQEKIDGVDSVISKLTEDIKSFAVSMSNQNKEAHKLEDNIQDLQDELTQKQSEEATRSTKITDLEEQIAGLENELSNLSESDVQPEIDCCQAEMLENTSRITSFRKQTDNIQMRIQGLQRDCRTYQVELKDLQDLKNRRLQTLRRFNKHAYDATLWLRENESLFKGKIYEPLMLLINVKDMNMAKFVENHISMDDMRAFGYENNDDMELFLRLVRDQQNLRVNMFSVPKTNPASFKPKYHMDELKPYGFTHYLRDLFECPDPLMSYLCANKNVHGVPVGTDYTKKHVERVASHLPGLAMFYTTNHQYLTKRSFYSGALSTKCTEVRQSSLLTSTCSKDMEELDTCIKNKLEEITQLHEENMKLEQENHRLETNLNRLRNRKKELMSQRNNRRTIEQKIQMKMDSKKRLESDAVDLKQETERFHEKISDIIKSKCEIQRDLQELTRDCMKLSEDRVRQCFERLTVTQEKETLEEKLREESNDVTLLMQECQQINTKVEELRDQSHTLLEAAKDAVEMPYNQDLLTCLTDRTKQIFATLPDTVKEIDTVIHEEQARADCTFQIDESIIEEYKKREKKIISLTSEVSKIETELHSNRVQIIETKTQWFEILINLVSRISNNFSYFFQCISCAGEVDLNIPENPEDYERYGLRIKVTFRDSDPLRELTAHHQSGGERSVATVLFIMALQELTTVPFRCVDEINQGMDPQNERKVFELVVQTACTNTTSQYFLLTPKLLPDLQYSENMTILAVYNGPNMIGHADWQLRKFIKRRKNLD